MSFQLILFYLRMIIATKFKAMFLKTFNNQAFVYVRSSNITRPINLSDQTVFFFFLNQRTTFYFKPCSYIVLFFITLFLYIVLGIISSIDQKNIKNLK